MSGPTRPMADERSIALSLLSSLQMGTLAGAASSRTVGPAKVRVIRPDQTSDLDSHQNRSPTISQSTPQPSFCLGQS